MGLVKTWLFTTYYHQLLVCNCRKRYPGHVPSLEIMLIQDHDSVERRVRPHPTCSLAIQERFASILHDSTPLRRPNCLSLQDLINRELRTPSRDPVSLFSLPGLMTFSKLVVCCESLVATERCARGTLHVRELCIKTVRKA